MSRLRRLLYVRVGIAAVAAITGSGWYAGMSHHASRQAVSDFSSGSGGFVFETELGGFKATFPTIPRQESSSVSVIDAREPVQRTRWISGSDRNLFEVAVWDMPKHATHNLKAVVPLAATDVRGWVMASSSTRFNGLRAAEGAVRANSGVIVDVLVFAAHGRLYELLANGLDQPVPGFERFKSSFTLT